MPSRCKKRVSRLAIAALVSAVMVVAGAVTSSAQESGSAARGQAYAKRHCGECHGVAAEQQISPIVGIAPFREIANTPGMTPLALKIWFQSPHPNMPLIVLSPDDRDDVVAYITSLRKK